MTRPGARAQDDVLLHLSDLHFGADGTAVKRGDRNAVLRSLLDSLRDLEPEWKPTIVAVTGDIGWAGRNSDYIAATQWLRSIASALTLPSSSFLFVPGNHDIDRTLARKIPRPDRHDVADRIFEDGIPDHYTKPFGAYLEFCRSFGCASYSFQGGASFLTGAATVGRTRFVGINTCWFSQDGEDKDRLRLSLALMRLLEADGSTIQVGHWDERPVTVALMHHPSHWLHSDETGDWRGPGEGSYLFLASRVHLLLCGHTHEAPRGHSRASRGGIELRCGASFAGADHPNTYQVVRFRTDGIEYRQFALDNRPDRRTWSSSDLVQVDFSDTRSTSSKKPASKPGDTAGVSLQELREKLAAFASDYVDAKSRALTPSVVPKIHRLHVEVQVERKFSEHRSNAEHVERLSLEQAVAGTPRLLLWGDLGAGKSTLVGQFTEMMNRSGDITVVLIPVAHLVPVPSTGTDLLDQSLRFVNSRLFPEHADLDLRQTMLGGVDDTVLIVDGLDEIDNKSARRILAALGSLPSSFSRLRVAATSRMVGNEYALGPEWSSATTATLQDDERLALLTSVGVASGLVLQDAEAEAKFVLGRIRADAIVEESARSPMALRLLHQELRSPGLPNGRSLGELLYRLLLQRLHHWEEADAEKRSPTTALCEALPSAVSRLELLSVLAHEILCEPPVTVERARALLRCAPVLQAAPEPAKAQALTFLEWTNLIRIVNDQVDFVLRPLFEVACASVVLDKLKRGELVPCSHWRTVAFAAAIARARGQLNELLPALLDYVRIHKDVDNWILPACYVVAESRDPGLARDVVSSRTMRRFEQPGLALAEERRTSAVAIAMTIHLAGDEGFEWFYRAFLDPTYPILHRGSAILGNIFGHWILLQGDSLSPRQAELLTSLPRSHLIADSTARLDIVPLVVLACPASVTPPEQAILLPGLLTYPSLSSRAEAALRRLFRTHPEEVKAALWNRVLTKYGDAARSSELWLEMSPPEQLPPIEIMSVALKARANRNGYFYSPLLWDILSARLGEAGWATFCRWQLADRDEQVAVGAALHLIERRAELAGDLRDVLLRGLHSDDRATEAETILAHIAVEDPMTMAQWLARKIADIQPASHVPASWWRLFLPLLPRLGTSGPSCLAVAAGGTGEYLLSRHADVRRLVRRLNQSPESDAYVKTLEDHLHRGTRSQRRGAAQLLICLGRSLGGALLACARTRSDRWQGPRSWDEYCLSLRFSPAVIEQVLAEKETLARDGKLFVLGLAVADGRQLNETDRRFVIESSDMIYSLPGLDIVLSDESAFLPLMSLVSSSDWRVAARAAGTLIRRHLSRLNLPMRLRCEILSDNRGLVAYVQLFRQLERDALRRAELIECGRGLAKEYGRRFILPALAEASADPSTWVDALLVLFGEGSATFEDDEPAWNLISIGNEFPSHGASIGEAARKICEDRRSSWSVDHVDVTPWLVLLAHEFGGIQANELLEFCNPHLRRPHLSSVLAALAARASSSSLVGAAPPEEARAPLCGIPASLDEIVTADRDCGARTETLCNTITRTLYQVLDDAVLEQLAARSARSRLIAGVLQYVHGIQIEPAWILRIISSEAFQWRHHDDCHVRLRRLAGLALRQLAREHPDKTRALLGAEVERGGHDALAAGARIAEAGWTVSPTELDVLINTYSEYPYYHWQDLLCFLITETMKSHDHGKTDNLLRRSISHSLDRLLSSGDRGYEVDPLALVIYASFAWIVGAEASQAPIAFRQGLAELVSGDKEQGGIVVLGRAVDLLKRVDPQAIREALTSDHGDHPAVVAVALILSSFVQPSTRTAEQSRNSGR